jgi:hypothetical protein
MAEVNFPTKLIRLTKATLTTVKYLKCGKGLDKETYYEHYFSMSYLQR